jgi:hypothetical protein
MRESANPYGEALMWSVGRSICLAPTARLSYKPGAAPQGLCTHKPALKARFIQKPSSAIVFIRGRLAKSCLPITGKSLDEAMPEGLNPARMRLRRDLEENRAYGLVKKLLAGCPLSFQTLCL